MQQQQQSSGPGPTFRRQLCGAANAAISAYALNRLPLNKAFKDALKNAHQRPKNLQNALSASSSWALAMSHWASRAPATPASSSQQVWSARFSHAPVPPTLDPGPHQTQAAAGSSTPVAVSMTPPANMEPQQVRIFDVAFCCGTSDNYAMSRPRRWTLPHHPRLLPLSPLDHNR